MTADNGTHGRRFLVVGVGFTALALVSAGCVEERRFAQAAATKDTRQLVIPSRITPPVTVARIEGAPKNWQFRERVAKALRRRDIPAGTRSRGKASYLVRGRAEPLPAKGGSESSSVRHLRISWSLHDASGKRVGTVVQVAAVPGAVWDKPDPRILDQIAGLAAASLKPYVPNAPVGSRQTASGAGSGRLTRPPVTAIGRQDARRGGRGLSGRLLAMRRVTGGRAQTPEERIARKRAAKTPPGTKIVAARPVLKPQTPSSATGAVTRRTVVTEGLARVAGAPAATGRKATLGKTRLKRPPVIKATATRGQAVRKPAAIRPDANRGKFRLPGGARSTRQAPVQIAEASRRGGAPVGMVQNTKGYWVQLASNTSAKASHAAWTALVSSHRGLLGRQPHAVNRADLGRKGIYYRLQLGPYPNVAQARRICASLRAARITCILVVPRGQVALRPPRGRRLKPRTAAPSTLQKPAPRKTATPKPAKPAPKAAKRPPKSGATATARGGAAASKAAKVRPAAGTPARKPRSASKKPKTTTTAKKPKSRAEKLPFQRSQSIPGVID